MPGGGGVEQAMFVCVYLCVCIGVARGCKLGFFVHWSSP